MESQRRTQLSTNQPPPTPAVIRPGLTSGTGFFARYGNTILTVILLVAAAVLAYRWYNRSADAARAAVVLQLETARQNVDQLRSPQLLHGANNVPLTSSEVMAKVRLLQTTTGGLLSDVINKADAPAVKARALVVRGDLAWAVANLPELPGATTQPALRLDPPADVMLGQAADAYTAVLSVSGADAASTDAAHLGLAAVAENRGDWATAKTQLQAVIDDTSSVPILSQAAKAQLAELPSLQRTMYVAPPTGIELPPITPAVPTTQGMIGPGIMGPMAPATRPSTSMPTTTLATTLPASISMGVPTTLPSVLPTTLPTTVPATQPGK